MWRTKTSWLTVLPVSSGGIGLFSGAVAMQLAGHAKTVMVLGTDTAGVLLSLTAAVVAIVKILAMRSPEQMRMATLTRMARQHKDPDRAMRLLMIDRAAGKAEAAAISHVLSLLNKGSATKGTSTGMFEVKDLVKRADAGEDVVPSMVPVHSPER